MTRLKDYPDAGLLHEELSGKGMQVIGPMPRDAFNAEEHQDDTDEIIWGDTPALHDTIIRFAGLGTAMPGRRNARLL